MTQAEDGASETHVLTHKMVGALALISNAICANLVTLHSHFLENVLNVIYTSFPWSSSGPINASCFLVLVENWLCSSLIKHQNHCLLSLMYIRPCLVLILFPSQRTLTTLSTPAISSILQLSGGLTCDFDMQK